MLSFSEDDFLTEKLEEIVPGPISANFLQASMRKRRKNGAMICGSADDKAAQLKSGTQVGKQKKLQINFDQTLKSGI